VFVESESRRIGQLHLPEALIERMRAHGRCVIVQMPDEARVQLLLEEYGFYAAQVDRFCEHLGALVELRGKAQVAQWQAQARTGQWAALFADLMAQHYDPLYLRSSERHFAGYADALTLDVADGRPETLAAAARTLLAAV
jgi:tRNA 2-selenouridine synthase